VALCLVLIALFLYNPFLAIYGSSPVTNLQHPASFRGTVASSELRRSRLTEALPKIYAPEEAAVETIAPSTLAVVRIGVPPEEFLDFQLQAFSENLWFRPPPRS
jgi:hypothetical protein